MQNKRPVFFFILTILLTTCGLLIYGLVETNETGRHRDVYQFESIEFANSTFDVVSIAPEHLDALAFYYKDEQGQKFATISNLKNWLKDNGKELIFATNGGIFSTTYTPLGLYAENGKTVSEINRNDGEGNFYLQPNGVFLIKKNSATIVKTEDYQDSSEMRFAIQSGPLLVIDNKINPLLNENSESRYIRSGVGITPNGNIVFAISNKSVTFFQFASLFKEKLNCQNALYLDGAISEIYVPGHRESTKQNFGVMIGMMEK